MEVDSWLIKKLFGEQGEKKLTDPEMAELISGLASIPSSQLLYEPGRLGEEKLNLQEETESLAFSNYKTFIQAANCSKDIYQDFTVINERLETVVHKLPELGTECREFLAEAQKISSRRATNTLTLNKHTQVLEVLEIPQVMDTCVRAGYWEEALEIINYVSKLQRRIGHIPVIQKIGEEVLRERIGLVDQLLEQLHLPLSLPHCLKVVGFLRRLSVFDETQLRIKFLQARGEWLATMLGSIPETDPYEHVTRTMEQSRVHLFDIITQYRAVFGEDEASSSTAAGILGFGGGLVPGGSAAGAGGKPLKPAMPTNLPNILHSWLLIRVNEFLDTLRRDVNAGLGGRMDSVMAQTMYFGLSFGRVGADFRALALPIFRDHIARDFEDSLTEALDRLMKEMEKEWYLDEIRNTSGVVAPSAAANNTSSNNPPMCLMDWQGLALFTNAILTSFNAHRVSLPLNLAPSFATKIQTALKTIAEQLAVVASQVSDAMAKGGDATVGNRRKDAVKHCTGLIVTHLAPFLQRALTALFPDTAMTKLTKGTAVHSHYTGKIGRLDLNEISGVLESYLPIIAPPDMVEEEENIDDDDNTVTDSQNPVSPKSSDHAPTSETPESSEAVDVSIGDASEPEQPPNVLSEAIIESEGDLKASKKD